MSTVEKTITIDATTPATITVTINVSDNGGNTGGGGGDGGGGNGGDGGGGNDGGVIWETVPGMGAAWDSNVKFTFYGREYWPESAQKPYSIQRATNTDKELHRHEQRFGDLWTSAMGGNDSERAEGDGAPAPFPKGTELWIAYSLMFEPGELQFTRAGGYPGGPAAWEVFGQLHANSIVPIGVKLYTEGYSPDGPHGDPPPEGNHERIGFEIQHDNGPRTKAFWKDPADLVRGKVYDIILHIRARYQNDDFAEAWCNGSYCGKYTGKLGKPDMADPWWKFGIYRGWESDDMPPIAVQYANMEVGTASLASRANNPPAWPKVTVKR